MSLLTGVMLALLAPAYSNTYKPCVTTSLGTICGTQDEVLGKPVSIYYGAPYAEPPIGEQRFMPPKPIEAWDREIDGTRPSFSCPQFRPAGHETPMNTLMFPKDDQSEDCLKLNVFVPQNAKGLPVMIWIHGGAFWTGSGTMEIYDGRVMAATFNVVVVTINYRLALFGFGFLSLPGMQGNVGLLDQRMALQWVQKNIAGFGGDPNAITIFGESAGGASISAHMIAPESQPFFTAAISESGTVLSPWGSDRQEDALKKTENIAKELGCDGDHETMLDCLMSLSTDKLANINPFQGGGSIPAVIVDNDPLFFGKPIDELLRHGDFSKKRYIIGTNRDEGTFVLAMIDPVKFSFTNKWNLDQEAYNQYGAAILKPIMADHLVSKALTFYDKPTKYGSYVECLQTMLGDLNFVHGAIALGRRLAKTSNRVHIYYFNVTSITSIFPSFMGSTHSCEIPFVFGTPLIFEDCPVEEKELSRQMMETWTSGAETEIPFDPSWPPIDPAEPIEARLFSTAGRMTISAFKEEEYTLWESLLNGDEGAKTRKEL